MLPYFTYDTSVFISRKLTNFHDMPRGFLMSAVVQMELMAGAPDQSYRKIYERTFRKFQKDNLLIVPNDDDWILAAKILYLLTHARKRPQRGKLHQLPPGVSQRLALDALIAVSARRWKAQVVTENWADFKSDSALLQRNDREGRKLLSKVNGDERLVVGALTRARWF